MAGAIRAERFLVAKPKLASGDKTASNTMSADSADSVQPLASGSGSLNQIAKWTDNSGGLGDSVITEIAGNIGIGTTTPGAPLEAYKSAGADATGGGVLVSRYNDGAGTFRGGAIYSRFISAVNYDALIFGVTSTGTKNPYADFDEARMVILANGNVGIGTTTPRERLDLSGTFRASGQNSPPASGAGVEVSYAGGVGYVQSYDRSAGGNKPLYLSGSNIQLNGGGEGNVGIGTTSPGFRLDVADRIRVRQGGSASAGMWLFQTVPGSDRAFVGMQDDNHVGLWGNTGAGWGLNMDTTLGNVGIGNPSPNFKLHVIDQSNAGLRVITNTPGGSVASFGGFGDFQVDAAGLPGGRFLVKESGNVGIGMQLPTEKLTVNGKIESIIGGFKFPDGTVQTTSANMTFTKLRPPNLTPLTMLGGNGTAGQQSAILMSVPSGTYVITATVEFRNNLNNVGNNSRRITCNLTNADPFSFDIAGLSRQTVTFHSVQSVQGGQGNVGPFCFHNGQLGEDVQTATSKLTAIKIEGTVSVQTDP